MENDVHKLQEMGGLVTPMALRVAVTLGLPDMRGLVLELLIRRARFLDLEVGTLTLAGVQVTVGGLR